MIQTELVALWIAIGLYVAAGGLAVAGLVFQREQTLDWGVRVAWPGLIAHGISLLVRWVRVGHGPYFSLYESLSSHIWIALAIFLVFLWRWERLKAAAAFILPLSFLLMGWVLLSSPADRPLPPTYDTLWLLIHILFAKVFFGSLLVALGLALLFLLRESHWGAAPLLASLPPQERLDDLSYRFVAFGLVFDTLMIIAGAIWAQEAWGRYWAWSDLEIWSLITWLLLGLYLHLRVTFRFKGARSAGLLMVAFAVAFVTFFGIPFVSETIHRGLE